MSDYYQIILRVIICEKGCKRGAKRLQWHNRDGRVGVRVIFKARQNRSDGCFSLSKKKATPLSERGPYPSG